LRRRSKQTTLFLLRKPGRRCACADRRLCPPTGPHKPGRREQERQNKGLRGTSKSEVCLCYVCATRLGKPGRREPKGARSNGLRGLRSKACEVRARCVAQRVGKQRPQGLRSKALCPPAPRFASVPLRGLTNLCVAKTDVAKTFTPYAQVCVAKTPPPRFA
jgi:hypothetical protein